VTKLQISLDDCEVKEMSNCITESSQSPNSIQWQALELPERGMASVNVAAGRQSAAEGRATEGAFLL
jgi:hypothetical protein